MDFQPCLLDRLTDDGSAVKISETRYREGVRRDLEWLFGASAHLPEEGLENFPEAFKSVINFGVRHLFGATTPNLVQLKRSLTEALYLFEPRIMPGTLQVSTKMRSNLVLLEVRADIWANPVPQNLHFKTRLDLESGSCTTT
jgi:type VI secretion system protein ImpF